MQMDFRTPPRCMRAIRLIVRSILMIATIDCIGAATASGLDKIRIGMGAFSPTNSAIWVAEERGLFGNTVSRPRRFASAGARRAASTHCSRATFTSQPRAEALSSLQRSRKSVTETAQAVVQKSDQRAKP